MARDARLEREFQEMVVAEGKKLGGFAANFKPNKVRAMKQHVGKGSFNDCSCTATINRRIMANKLYNALQTVSYTHLRAHETLR